MNKKYMFIFLFLLLGAVFISAQSYEESYTNAATADTTGLQVDALKYEPYPVNPGEYFTLWISVKKTGSGNNAAVFELDPEFPFSLDSNEEATKTFSGLLGESALLEYKIRVNDDAVEGENEIKLRYRLEDSNSWVTKTFKIQVESAQTSFDGVIQDMESGSLSLALANVGKNVANSVIVRIPEQEGFVSTGVSGQMVGNLDNGDYTIVSFEVSQKDKKDDTITFQIDYTDTIGVRRTVYLDQKVSGSSTAVASNFTEGQFGPGSGGFNRSGQFQKQSSNSWKYALAIIFVGSLSYLVFRRRYIKKRELLKNSKK